MGQYGFAYSREKKLFATQKENRFRYAPEKNGGCSLSGIAGSCVSTDQMLAFSKTNFLQALLNHLW